MALLEVEVSDSVVVSDVSSRQLNSGGIAKVFDIQVSEEISVVDSVVQERVVADSVSVSDSASAVIIETLTIANARALSETKVRIDFSAAALDPSDNGNPALLDPSSYVFTAVTPGAVGVVPQSVSSPVGQTNPLYVEIDITEHTNGAIYEVSISPLIKGALGEAGGGAAYSYAGLGSSPIVELVLATSKTEAVVQFDEAILDNSAARDISNFIWDNGLSTVSVKSVIGNEITLQTTEQTPGELYNLTVRGILQAVISDQIQITEEIVIDSTQLSMAQDGVSMTEDGVVMVQI